MSEPSPDDIMPPHAAEERRAMQAALGKALSDWQRIEGALSWLFDHAMKSGTPGAAASAFSAVHSVEVQIDMTDAALQCALRKDTKHLERWTQLRRRIDRLRPKRNRLAHGQIAQRTIVGSGEVTTRYLPFYYLEHHQSWEAFAQWTLKDLETVSKAFKALATDMRQFWWHIHWGEALSPKFPEPTPELDPLPD